MTKKHHHTKAHSEAPLDPPPEPQADGTEQLAVETEPPGPEAPDSAVAPPSAARQAPSPALEELNDKYLRLAAEYDNFRRRTAKERLELSARAQGELVKAIIDPLDDLARIIAQGPGANDAKTVLDAVEVVDKKMMKALVALGLEVINPVGEPFDPERHEAVSIAPAPSKEEDHRVSQVFQPGYLYKGQLLRAARVVVMQWNG